MYLRVPPAMPLRWLQSIDCDSTARQLCARRSVCCSSLALGPTSGLFNKAPIRLVCGLFVVDVVFSWKSVLGP